MEHFKDLLLVNNCHIDHLKKELEILSDHINRHVPEKCWPINFCIGDDLGIHNLLHILEICLVAPLSNAESERVFSLLWHIFSKEHQSLKRDTLEILLHIELDSNQRKAWRCCWNAFKNTQTVQSGRKRIICKVMCTHLIKHH